MQLPVKWNISLTYRGRFVSLFLQNVNKKKSEEKIEFTAILLDFRAPRFRLTNFSAVFKKKKWCPIFDILNLDPSRMESYARHLSPRQCLTQSIFDIEFCVDMNLTYLIWFYFHFWSPFVALMPLKKVFFGSQIF